MRVSVVCILAHTCVFYCREVNERATRYDRLCNAGRLDRRSSAAMASEVALSEWSTVSD